MKRFLIIILAMATLVAAPEQVQAQGFLKKLKEKASNAVSNTVGKVTGIDMGQQDEQQQIDGQENQITTTASATDKIPKLRQTSFVWDAEVQPSTASTVNALMQELPALPSVEEIVNPNQHSREIYYNQIVAVNLRIDELDAQWACSDAEMVAEREKLYAELQDILGLTVEEQKRLDDPAVSEAEKAALEEKIKKHIIGDFDQEKVTNTIESKRERVNQLSAESKELEKKAEKGTLTPEETNRMMEISNEIMQIQGELMQSLNMGNVMETTQKMTAFANKYSMQQQQLMQKVKQYQDKAAALAGECEGSEGNLGALLRFELQRGNGVVALDVGVGPGFDLLRLGGDFDRRPRAGFKLERFESESLAVDHGDGVQLEDACLEVEPGRLEAVGVGRRGILAEDLGSHVEGAVLALRLVFFDAAVERVIAHDDLVGECGEPAEIGLGSECHFL